MNRATRAKLDTIRQLLRDEAIKPRTGFGREWDEAVGYLEKALQSLERGGWGGEVYNKTKAALKAASKA